jgi:hypothetical protein
MDQRRFVWRQSGEAHALTLAWVPGTSGTPYAFGHGPRRRSMELRGFFLGTTPVTQALWQHVGGENPAVHRNLHYRVWWRYGIEPDAHDGCIGLRLVLARPWTTAA